MPADNLSTSLIVPQRVDSRTLYLSAYSARNPTAITTENSFPWIDAACMADMLQMVFRNCIVTHAGIGLTTATGTVLDQRLADLGLTRAGAQGASGYVSANTSGGGSTIFQDDILRNTVTGLRYKVNNGAPGGILYHNTDPIPVTGIDIGEQSNVDAATLLTWVSPRPGSGASVAVLPQADGISGLTGGRGIESDADAILRAIQIKANPPASGNDAQYQARGSATPGLAVQQVFTYPGINGPGTIGFVFLLRPASPGGSRIPNSTQITQVLVYLTTPLNTSDIGAMPADDQIFPGTVTTQPTDIALKVAWARGAPSWADSSPWPTYYPNPGQALLINSAASSTSFSVKTQNGVYTGIRAPAAGQSVAVYETAAQLFRRKTILSVSGTGPWTFTIDTTNGISDTSYMPIANQRICPWSDSLNQVSPALVGYFDTLGPGEQVSSFFDPGMRQRRSPESPDFWPHQISNRLTVPILELAVIRDAALVEPTIPFETTVGIPGALSYLLTLGTAALFPQ